jgi:hypothetical protein
MTDTAVVGVEGTGAEAGSVVAGCETKVSVALAVGVVLGVAALTTGWDRLSMAAMRLATRPSAVLGTEETGALVGIVI